MIEIWLLTYLLFLQMLVRFPLRTTSV
jgi:hypothetical protein